MRRGALAKALLGIGLGGLLAVAPVTAASAHNQLNSTDPVANSTLASAPSVITLTFEEAPLAEGDFVTATSAAGDKVALGAPVVNEEKVTATWPATANSGTYTVSWRVVADDGHPVSGSFSFTIAGASTASASASASPPPVASGSSTPADASSSGSSSNTLWWVIGAVALVAGLTALIFSLRSTKSAP